MSETLTFDKSIKKIDFLFKCTGLNIKSSRKKNHDKFKSIFVYVLNFIWLNTDLLGAILWFVSGLVEGKNFTELTYVAPCITLSFLANFKSLFLVIYNDKIHKLIDMLRFMEIQENDRKKDVEKDMIIKNEINFLNAVVNILSVFNGILIVMFALCPLILMALKYAKTEELETLLPFLVVYPFNPYDIKIWPVVYLRQVWSEIIVVIDITAVDFLFFTFCTHLSIQFRLLCHNIERIIPSNKNLNFTITYDERYRQKFFNIIKWHQDLMEAAELLETLYTKSTLYNFVSSSIVICLTGFNVTAIKDVALVITFLSFLLMSLLQIFFLCFFGDKMMKASMEVSDAVYNSKWYLADSNVGKHCHVIQTRGQRPCKLTASGFADVNLRAFMKILSTSWSYFALLQTLYGTPNQQS